MKRKTKVMGASHSYGTASSKSGTSYVVAQHATSSSAQEFFPVPLEILEEIFLRVPADQVVHVCRLVCSQWKEVADSESLWRVRCRREGYNLCDSSKTPEDWRLFYFLCKKRRNLLKNTRGEENMAGWTIKNGGDGWNLEDVMVPHPNEVVKKNFVTSYGMCTKEQLIDLEKEGYSTAFMDNLQPHIKISDWYAPRWDCGCEYSILVQLLDAKQKVIQSYAPDTVFFDQWNDQEWNRMIHVFRDYGPGVRYIHFRHGGKDTQFWAGWYGIRVTDSSVEICPAVNT
ncbi:F-box only protein 6 [Haplochromis burtoni]|uniref:F-box only protein 6-like n=1 Tax=Haplochromis burtoni TaxID=8153 RepID=A0A3Q2VAS8_HAPBU|nr:F-box only protein 6 [Haplochromis burtoni]XP_042080208.1 F-box only protein 6 [Haplochromis burtoni]